jgi:hypothetical protein
VNFVGGERESVWILKHYPKLLSQYFGVQMQLFGATTEVEIFVAEHCG